MGSSNEYNQLAKPFIVSEIHGQEPLLIILRKRLVSLIHLSKHLKSTYSIPTTVFDVTVNKTDTNPTLNGAFMGAGANSQDK